MQNPQTQNVQPTIITATAGEAVYLPPGSYAGRIVGCPMRSSEFKDRETGEQKTVQYVDFEVEDGASGKVLTYGVPARVSPKSDLGALMLAFGHAIPAPGVNFNVTEAFVGRKVAFIVQDEKTDKGTFSRIVKGSLRLVA